MPLPLDSAQQHPQNCKEGSRSCNSAEPMYDKGAMHKKGAMQEKGAMHKEGAMHKKGATHNKGAST